MHFINNKNDKLNPNIPFREIKSFLKNLKNIKEYKLFTRVTSLRNESKNNLCHVVHNYD